LYIFSNSAPFPRIITSCSLYPSFATGWYKQCFKSSHVFLPALDV
jgi:hypothetical protein